MCKMQSALTLAEKGYSVFPLNGKVPIYSGSWRDAATQDQAIILDWWSEHPNANIGIALPKEVAVLDVDIREDKDGLSSLRQMYPDVYADVVMGEGVIVNTPSGGYHAYYRTDRELSNSASSIGTGLDVKTLGGYVVAYSDQLPIPNDLPQEPAGLFERRVREKKEAPTNVKLDSLGSIAQAIQYISNAPTLIDGEGSDHKTFAMFAKLRDIGVSKEMALSLAREWIYRCRFDTAWVESKATNAYNYAENDAGCSSPEALFGEVIEEYKSQGITNRFAKCAIVGDAINRMKAPIWKFKKLILDRSLNMIRGAYSTKKTFVALDLALSASVGKDWAGHECEKSLKVLYCAGEGSFGMRARVRAWAKAKNKGNTPDNFILLPTVPAAASQEDWGAFVEYVEEEKPDLIFLDTMARTTVGLDEMSSKDTAVFVEKCAQLQRLGASVFVIHHEGKDSTKGSRGSTALPAAMDLELAVSIDGGMVKVTMAKVKDAPEWEGTKGFNWSVVQVSDDPDDSSLVLNAIAQTDVRTQAPEKMLDIAKDLVKQEEEQADDEILGIIRPFLKSAHDGDPNSCMYSHKDLAEYVIDTMGLTGNNAELKKEAIRQKLYRKSKSYDLGYRKLFGDGHWRYSP